MCEVVGGVTPCGRVIVDVACRLAAMLYCEVCPCILIIGNAAFRSAAMLFVCRPCMVTYV
jgi:hypothetical protein